MTSLHSLRRFFLVFLLFGNMKSAYLLNIRCNFVCSSWCVVLDEINESEKINILPINGNYLITGLRMDVKSNLIEIPTIFFEHFPTLQSVHIQTGIKKLSTENFKQAKSVTNLELNGNLLTYIPKEVFAEAINLSRLDLQKNEINEIADYAFSGPPNLDWILLNKNRLTIIRKETFAGVPKLYNIWLSDNQIEVIEDGAFDLPNLKLLALSNNKIRRLSENLFVNAPLLESISIDTNEFTKIGEAFTSLKELIILGLENNHIEDLDLTKFINPKLNTLWLGNTGFQPSNVSVTDQQTIAVSSLFIQNNNLSDPNIFYNLRIFKNLRWLDISFNNFTQINHLDEIKDIFPKLEYVKSIGNPLSCAWIQNTKFNETIFSIGNDFNKKGTLQELPCE